MKLLKADKKIFTIYMNKMKSKEIFGFDFCTYDEKGYTVEVPINSLFDSEDGESWYGIETAKHFDGRYAVMGCYGGGGLLSHDLDWDMEDLTLYIDGVFQFCSTDMIFIDYNSIQKSYYEIFKDGYNERKYRDKLLKDLTNKEIEDIFNSFEDVTLEENEDDELVICSDWYYWDKGTLNAQVMSDLIYNHSDKNNFNWEM